MRVIGIDPGSIKTGFAIVEYSPKSHQYIAGGTIALDESADLGERLSRLSKDFKKIISHYKPEEMALETMFFAKNAQSAIKLSHARGVLLMEAASSKLKIFEYSPTNVKNSICGTGRAKKDQISQMVKMLLKLKPDFEFTSEDESDALALCLTHAQTKPRTAKVAQIIGKKNDRSTFWQTRL
jgi:crossover junction endodeoxyribonuclease RuvC